MDKDELYQLIGFIQRSKHRRKLLECLSDKTPKTPTELATTTGIHPVHVSNRLADLRENQLVTIMNPNDHIHRYYTLTAKGNEVVKELKNRA